MTTYLITGCTGYIGSFLLDTLTAQPEAKIYGLTRQPIHSSSGYHLLQGDLLIPELPELLASVQPDVIFHLAAAHRAAPLSEQLHVNVLGTQYLLQSLHRQRLAPRVILLGSAAEYGPLDKPVAEGTVLKPQSDYAIAKAAQTHAALCDAKRFDLSVIIGRCFNVYGYSSDGLVIGALASQIAHLEAEKSSQPILKTQNMRSHRDFIHINDIVQALLALADKGLPGEIYNIGSGTATPIQTVLETLLRHSTLQNVLLEPQGEQIPDVSQANVDKIRQQTGWYPHVPLEEGLAQELDFWRAQIRQDLPVAN